MCAMSERPIGLHLAQAQKAVARAFNDALAEAGGSVPVWLVLLSAAHGRPGSQLDLARAVGIEGPTLTRHLDRLEESGLVVRKRDPDDRRAIRVELTEAGERLFGDLRQAAIAFDRRLTAGFEEGQLDELRALLDRLAANVSS
jgi:MarR family transcriptional regulator, transcriptional regulator for hemolysin